MKNISMKKIVFISFVLIAIMGMVIVSKSYAIYKLEEKYNIIESKIENFSRGDIEVAVLVDGKESTTFPTYEDNYLVTGIDCTNGAKASWDIENWRIAIDDMSVTSTKCTISFDSSKKNSIEPINMSKTEILALNEEYQNLALSTLLDKVYPVGSIYISTEDDTIEKVTNRFGGTWVKYSEGTMLMGANATYPVNTTGGSTTATLSTNNLPSHTHNVTAAGSVSSSFSGSRNITESTGGGYSIGYGSSSRGVSSWSGSHSHDLTGPAGHSYGVDINGGSSGSYGVNFVMRAYSINNSGWYGRMVTTGTGITVSGQTTTDYYANSISGVAAHQHYYTATGSVSSSFTGSAVTSTATGSGTAFNIQNPYTAVYMYKRTA